MISFVGDYPRGLLLVSSGVSTHGDVKCGSNLLAMVYTADMSDEIEIDSQKYVSSKRASELSGYAQDYIGQLSRSGQIKARRVGGLWYVSMDSLNIYKDQAESYKALPPAQISGEEPDSLVTFDGKDHVSASRAAKLTGYHQDYVGQLARAGTIPSRQVGNRWYVEREALMAHKKGKDALLAAVQAEAVGIKRPTRPPQDAFSGMRYSEPGPLLSYSKDEQELVPVLADKEQILVGETVDETHSIPIRVVEEDEREIGLPDVRPRGYSKNFDHEPAILGDRISRKAIHPLILPVAALMTIIIVLSFGFISLKNSSLYTQSVQQSEEKVVQVASVGNTLESVRTFIAKVGDVLELWFVPEIVYRSVN